MRFVIYDRTCPRLGRVWAAGARLYKALGWIDAFQSTESWDIRWPERVDELQYWGHGKWGQVLAGKDVLHAGNLDRLAPLRGRVSLVWFRTCETFGAHAGHDFATRLADYLGARVAGHTFVIGYRQSGLHALAPGERPTWPAHEGLAEGSPDAPKRAHGSSWRTPRTITALTPRLPRWA
jgi:hypothetical protein